MVEQGNNRIQAIQADTGTHVRFFGTGTAGDAADQLSNPYSVTLHEPASGPDNAALLFEADTGNHRVQVFSADTGALVRTVGTAGQAGAAVGQVSGPAGLTVHPEADGAVLLLFITEANNHRVQVFAL